MGNSSVKVQKNLNGYTFIKKTTHYEVCSHMSLDCSKFIMIEDYHNPLTNFVLGKCKIVVLIFNIETGETNNIKLPDCKVDFKNGVYIEFYDDGEHIKIICLENIFEFIINIITGEIIDDFDGNIYKFIKKKEIEIDETNNITELKPVSVDNNKETYGYYKSNKVHLLGNNNILQEIQMNSMILDFHFIGNKIFVNAENEAKLVECIC